MFARMLWQEHSITMPIKPQSYTSEWTMINGQSIATWRLKARKSRVPVCGAGEHKPKWNKERTVLLCATCGLDCT